MNDGKVFLQKGAKKRLKCNLPFLIRLFKSKRLRLDPREIVFSLKCNQKALIWKLDTKGKQGIGATRNFVSATGLPDGTFSNQKSQFGQILEGLAMENL
jgi:hypothetical protein